MSTPNDGGAAFPTPDTIHANGQVQYGRSGMSLRDWFAAQPTADEIASIKGQHLSRMAQEELAGMEMPIRSGDLRGSEAVKRQLEELTFHASVDAAIRMIHADAMLAARERKETLP